MPGEGLPEPAVLVGALLGRRVDDPILIGIGQLPGGVQCALEGCVDGDEPLGVVLLASEDAVDLVHGPSITFPLRSLHSSSGDPRRDPRQFEPSCPGSNIPEYSAGLPGGSELLGVDPLDVAPGILDAGPGVPLAAVLGDADPEHLAGEPVDRDRGALGGDPGEELLGLALRCLELRVTLGL